MNLVVDASVAIKWYIKEVHTADAEYLLDDRFVLHAPELLLTEFANILWKKCRNDDVDDDTAESIIDSFLARPITLHSHKSLVKAAYVGAKDHGQAVYDWTYLSLAVKLGYPFVTADRKFFLALRGTPFKKNVVWIEIIPDLI